MMIFLVVIVAPILTVVFEIGALIVSYKNNSEKEKYIEWREKHSKMCATANWYKKYGWAVELLLYFICFVFEYLCLDLIGVDFSAGWEKQIYTNQLHQPIATQFMPSVVFFAAVYFIGLVYMYISDARRSGPLAISLGIAALYLGIIYSIIWTFHIHAIDEVNVMLLILPVNTILISARLIMRKVMEFRFEENRKSKVDANPFLSFCYEFKETAVFLPLLGVIMLLPLLGVMVVILLIFGQAPDAAIKAFTETSDFRLSTKVSPQSICADDHYLCTVAAGGDRKVVKPLRKGTRKGHEIIVNRQLEIANAFEEVIMIHTPKFHKHLRHFYDNYGFPIAKLIKKNWVADLVYFIMKPLEWIFIIVLYLVEVHPEDRIAMQYTGTTLERFM